jgi:hypothetical protein
MSLLGKRDQYHNFLTYFQQEIDAKGVEAVLKEYLFAGDEYADAMFVRFFGGLSHGYFCVPISSVWR